MTPDAVCVFFSVIMGACFASFIETAAWRTVNDTPWWGTSRSSCPQCGATLSAPDLIPVLSYIVLRGKCRHCGSPISVRHPITEVVLAALWGVVVYRYGASYGTLMGTVLIGFAFFHSMTDIYSGYIMDNPVFVMLGTGLLMRLGGGFQAVIDGLLGAAAGWGAIAVIILASRGGMGWGDAMLMLGIGGFLGLIQTAIALYTGFAVAGTLAVVLLIMRKVKRKDAIPLGPYLAIGAFIALIWGHRIAALFSHNLPWPWFR